MSSKTFKIIPFLFPLLLTVWSSLAFSQTSGHWWKRMAQDELAKLPSSSSNPNAKEIENHIFSQYLKMLDEIGLLVATEELRLEMIAEQGGSESIAVVTACSIDTYSQWSNLLPAAIGGSSEIFGTVYCQLECLPPGADHATYSESSLSCQEEAASLYSLYHECDSDIQKAQGFGFDGNLGNGTQPIVEGSIKYGSSSLFPIISERAAVCIAARRLLMTASFDESLVPTMPSSERPPESFSTYEPDYGGQSGGFSVPTLTPPPSHCMTSSPEDRINRVAKLREYYAEVRESLIYERFGSYSSPDFEAITATTNGFFEEFFQDADPVASISPCANGTEGVGSNFKTFLNTYVGPALDSLSLTGQIGTGNAQQEAAKAHLDRVLEQITVVGTRIEDQTPEKIAALNAELDLVKLELHDAYNPYGVWGGAVGDAIDPTIIAWPTAAALKKVLTNKKLAVSTIRAWHGFAKFLSKPLLLGREAGAIGKKSAHVRWGIWTDLPRVTVNSIEYAKIGDRRYTRHAIDRMTPTGMGTAAGGTAGRGVPTMVVEATLKFGNLVKTETTASGILRETWKMDTVEVITENSKELVLTVMRVGG